MERPLAARRTFVNELRKPTLVPTLANSWTRAHNTALEDWIGNTTSYVSAEQADAEKVLLDLMFGAWRWLTKPEPSVQGAEIQGADGFAGMQITHPLIGAIRAALNFECGRLDCGTLDAWLCALSVRCEIDPDDGNWITS